MSLDAIAYTVASEAPLAEEVAARLCAKGWTARFVDAANLREPIEGPVRSSLVLGWHRGTPEEASILSAIAREDEDLLNSLFAEDRLTSCALTYLRGMSSVRS